MHLLANKNLRKFILSVILTWATLFFWLLSPVQTVNILVTVISVLCFLAVLFEKNSHFIVIYLSFISAYVLYGYVLVNNFPFWLMMIGILLIYLYLYGYLEQMIELISGEKVIYWLIFSLISVETFLFLGYYIISPINRSLILSATVYMIFGFLDSLYGKKNPRAMMPYILVFSLIFVTMLLTASWGSY